MLLWLPFAPEQLALAPLPNGLEVDVYPGTGEPPASIERVEAVVVPYPDAGDLPPLLARMPRLRVVQTLTAGVDHVRPFLPEGATLCNGKGIHDAATAEMAVTLMLSSFRGIPDFVHAQEQGRWAPRHRRALADHTVLIVGYGAIGAAIERRLAGFEVEVLRVARTARPDDDVFGFEDLPGLLPRADVVMLVVPLTERTHHLVDAKFLAAMPDGALLVNVARGPVVDTDALVAELATGRLSAALDVTDPEPLPADHPLWGMSNTLITPHVAGGTSAFDARAKRLLDEQLGRLVDGRPLLNVVSGVY